MTARVPDDWIVPQVLPRGGLSYQEIHPKPESFGVKVGQTLQRMSRMAERDALLQQNLMNKVGVDDLYANRFDPAARDLYDRYLALRGKDAAQAFPDYLQKMQDLVSDVHSNLSDDTQRRQFDLMAAPRVQANLDAMARHRADQTGQWISQTGDAMTQMLARRIAEERCDFDRVAGPGGLIQAVKNVCAGYGNAAGEDPAASALKASAAIDKGLSDGVLTEASMNPEGARLLYGRYAPLMSSDAVRQHVLDNLLPALRREQSRAAYDDAVSRFDLLHSHADLDAAVNWVMDPENYKQLDGPDQRADLAGALRGAWNRAELLRRENRSAADSAFTRAVADGKIFGLDLQTWKDPVTGLPPSENILRAAMERDSTPREAAPAPNSVGGGLAPDSVGSGLAPDSTPREVGLAGDKTRDYVPSGLARDNTRDQHTLAALAEGISGRRLDNPGPINEAFLRGFISDRDFNDLSALYRTFRDPDRSRWFDYAKDAFDARFGASPPGSVPPSTGAGGPSASADLLPGFLTALDQTVREQNLKNIRICDAADKMLQDLDKAYVGQAFGRMGAGSKIGPVREERLKGDAAPDVAPGLPEAISTKGPASDDKNTGSNINAGTNVVESSGERNQMAQGQTGGARQQENPWAAETEGMPDSWGFSKYPTGAIP